MLIVYKHPGSWFSNPHFSLLKISKWRSTFSISTQSSHLNAISVLPETRSWRLTPVMQAYAPPTILTPSSVAHRYLSGRPAFALPHRTRKNRCCGSPIRLHPQTPRPASHAATTHQQTPRRNPLTAIWLRNRSEKAVHTERREACKHQRKK
jgi:hypothetical protein